MRATACLGVVLGLLSACDGQIADAFGGGGGPGPGGGGVDLDGDGVPDVDVDGDGVPDQPNPHPFYETTDPSVPVGIRNLTRAELARSIAVLTGVTADTSALPKELELVHLSNDASRGGVHDVAHMRALFELATRVAAEAPIATVIPCAAAVCTDGEIERFLERAFVKPIAAEALADYRGIYDTTRAERDENIARRAVLQSVLFSPAFLMRTEVGGDDGRLTGPELAAKLSFFLWGEPPDDALRTAAFDGSLLDDATYAAEVDRLIDDPRARRRFTHFVFEWLGLDDLDLASKAGADELPPELGADMAREVELLVGDVLFDRGLGLRELLIADETFVNERLAAVYGISGVTGEEFRRVSLAGTERLGILTTPIVLAAHAKETGRSPMQRGHFLLDQVMCHSFPSDAGVAIMRLPEAEPGQTFRDQFAVLETTAPCSNCHRTLNAGFVLDIFDTFGRRDPDVGAEEAAAFFMLPPWETLRFETTVEGVTQFADHPAVPRCMVAQAYRFAQGRMPGADDAATLAALWDAFDAAGRDVRDLLREIALSERFRAAAGR